MRLKYSLSSLLISLGRDMGDQHARCRIREGVMDTKITKGGRGKIAKISAIHDAGPAWDECHDVCSGQCSRKVEVCPMSMGCTKQAGRGCTWYDSNMMADWSMQILIMSCMYAARASGVTVHE
jgi:hypothetical protein